MVRTAAQGIGMLTTVMWWVFWLAISKPLPPVGFLTNVIAIIMGPFLGLMIYVTMMRG